MNHQKKTILIKLAYWLGITADALWAIALFSPQIFSLLTGRTDFEYNSEIKQVMYIGGVLMTGWTILLFWAVKKPVERRKRLL